MDDIAFRLLDWVCKNVEYRSDNGEYWLFPDETLRQMAEDCDGSSILLASMLRQAGYPPDRVYVVIGTYRGLGHAWVTLDDKILETTYSSAHTVPDPHNYKWLAAFNDVEVIERYPGATSRLYQLVRNEGLKLTLMQEAQECPSLWPPLIIGLAMGGILGTGFAMILQKEYGRA